MSIVCGIDFSASAEQAWQLAARIAQRSDEPLLLVHVLETSGAAAILEGPPLAELEQLRRDAAWAKLSGIAAAIRDAGTEVQKHLLEGDPADALAEVARREHASLIVVGTHGHGPKRRSLIGSVAARVGELADIPALIVPSAPASLGEALEHDRPLRALVAIDEGSTGRAAIAWARQLRARGPCDLHFRHWYWPPAAYRRFGLTGRRDWFATDDEAAALLERNLRALLDELPGEGAATLRVSAHWGPLGPAIVDAAEQVNADLVVMGTHQRELLRRFVSGSVSHQVIARAVRPTVLVPHEPPAGAQRLPTVHQVLVPVDLGQEGREAVAHAYGLVGPDGGIVHLLHVVENPRFEPFLYDERSSVTPERRAALESSVRALIPAGLERSDVVTEVHVVEASSIPDAIAQVAERLGVDMVCLWSHARSGMSRILEGSVTAKLLHRTRLPTLIMQAARD